MKNDSYSHVKCDNKVFRNFLYLTLTAPLILAIVSGFILKKAVIVFVLYVPLYRVTLPLVRAYFEHKWNLDPVYDLPGFTAAADSFGKYFALLHERIKSAVEDFAHTLRKRGQKHDEISEEARFKSVSAFFQAVIPLSIFRLFLSSIFFENAAVLSYYAVFCIVFVHIFRLLRSLVCKKDKKVLSAFGKSALFDIMTLPQRASVTFDACLRGAIGIFLNKKSARFLEKSSVYADVHTNPFVYISSYFCSFAVSIFLIVSGNAPASVCGVIFALAPIYYVFSEKNK